MDNKECKLVHTPTEDMIADMGTIPLTAKTLKIFMGALNASNGHLILRQRTTRYVYMTEIILIVQNQRKRQIHLIKIQKQPINLR